MSADHDRTDEPHAEAHDADDERLSREESRRRFPSIPVSPLGLWPSSDEEDAYRASHEEAYSDEEFGEAADEEARTARGIGRFRDEGLIRLLIFVGAVLFLFPEPATSALGILLMGIGIVAWLVDRAT